MSEERELMTAACLHCAKCGAFISGMGGGVKAYCADCHSYRSGIEAAIGKVRETLEATRRRLADADDKEYYALLLADRATTLRDVINELEQLMREAK